MTSTDELQRTLEGLLFLSSDPVSAQALADATGAELHEVMTALERLREYYEFERRGLVVRELAGGFTLSTHPDLEPAARRLFAKPRTPPLTPAQAETLAIVAYLQPVSAAGDRADPRRQRRIGGRDAARARDDRGGGPVAVRRHPVSHDRPVPASVRADGDRRAARRRAVRSRARRRGRAARAPAARRRGTCRGWWGARRPRARSPRNSTTARPSLASASESAAEISTSGSILTARSTIRHRAAALPSTSAKPRKMPPVTTRASTSASRSAREHQPSRTGS